MKERYYGTGKRKTSIARVWLTQGDGNITINKKSLNEYFKTDTAVMTVNQPLVMTGTLKKYDIIATIAGGGMTGQSGALKHGISKVLIQAEPSVRLTLKRAGFLTRDSRIKERKKYGRKGARKSFQFSKR